MTHQDGEELPPAHPSGVLSTAAGRRMVIGLAAVALALVAGLRWASTGSLKRALPASSAPAGPTVNPSFVTPSVGVPALPATIIVAAIGTGRISSGPGDDPVLPHPDQCPASLQCTGTSRLPSAVLAAVREDTGAVPKSTSTVIRELPHSVYFRQLVATAGDASLYVQVMCNDVTAHITSHQPALAVRMDGGRQGPLLASYADRGCLTLVAGDAAATARLGSAAKVLARDPRLAALD